MTACCFNSDLRRHESAEVAADLLAERVAEEARDLFVSGCCQPHRQDNIREAMKELAEGHEFLFRQLSGAMARGDTAEAGRIFCAAVEQYWNVESGRIAARMAGAA